MGKGQLAVNSSTNAAGGVELVVAGVTSGTVDLVITGQVIGSELSLTGENDLGIRLNEVDTSNSDLGQIELPTMGWISGRVLLAGTANKLRDGTDIFIEGLEENFFTGTVTNDTFILPRVPVGDGHTLYVSRQGFERQEVTDVVVSENTNKSVGDITIFPEGGAYGAFSLSGGAAATTSLSVKVDVTASANATSFMFGEDQTFANQTFSTLAETANYTFSAAPGLNSSTLTLWGQFANNDNGLQTVTSLAIRYDDGLDPVATISKVGGGESTNVGTTDMRVDFSEEVSGFTAADLSVVDINGTPISGALQTLVADSAGGWTFSVVASQSFSIQLESAAVADLEGNINAATSKAIAYDDSRPSAALLVTDSSSDEISGPTNLTTWTVKLTFSKPVTGIEQGDITVTEGTASNFVGFGAAGSIFYFDVTPSEESVEISVADGAGKDSAGNDSTSDSETVMYGGLSLLATSTSLGTSVEANSLAYYNDYLFVGHHLDGKVSIVNVTDPSNPVVQAGALTHTDIGPVRLIVSGTTLWVAIDVPNDGDVGLIAYDISNPASPSRKDDLTGKYLGVAVIGGYAYGPAV